MENSLSEPGCPRVIIVRTREEFLRHLSAPMTGDGWLQVEGLLADQEVWAAAAQGSSPVALDVIVTDPRAEFASLYRLVDVRMVRGVRVTLPVVHGMMKALRLAVSIQLPVRLLPVQPTAGELAELAQAADFYLRDPSVEAPVEYFHSVFAAMRGADTGTLWNILEGDPAFITHADADGNVLDPGQNQASRLRGDSLLEDECLACRWLGLCAGYFKHPQPGYDCAGVKSIFATLEAAAGEMTRDLAELEEEQEEDEEAAMSFYPKQL